MDRSKKKYLIIIFLIAIVIMVKESASPGLTAAEISPGLKNYYQLREMYSKWREGLFGSRKANERLLRMFLVDLLYKEFETEPDYFLVSPDGILDKRVTCKFRYGKWLYIHGEVDVQHIKDLVEGDPDLLKTWWRSTNLLSVSGRMRRFRFGKDRYRDTIDLWLDKVKVKK